MFQGSSRFPQNNLQCSTLKETLSRELVSLVARHGDHVLAFRVIWRATDDCLDDAWDAIIDQRRKCDSVVRTHPNVELFVSSITGVFTKSTTKGSTPRAIYPAVGYWLVLTSSCDYDVVRAQVMRRLGDVCRRSELKLIKAQQRQPREVVACLSAPLYVVLKDHRSSYIRRRVVHSLGKHVDVGGVAPSRIVVMADSKYRERIITVIETLREQSLCADIVISDDTKLEN